MTDDEAWEAEERFWTEGPEFYRERLSEDCLLVFAAPTGILQGTGFVDDMKGEPLWVSVSFSERAIARPSSDVVTLAYMAEGEKHEGEEAVLYRAHCSSSYVRDGERWLLFQHQQTPEH